MNKFERSRRAFLRSFSYASMAGITASPFLLRLQAMAAQTPQTGTGYRALVCICQGGGNDGHNVLIATDQTSFNAYTQARAAAPGLAFGFNQLLPVSPATPQSGHTFGLNPYLSGLQSLFENGKLAFIANAGTLIAPTTKTQYNNNSVPLPLSLFSHANQSNEWQSIASNGTTDDYRGWGGSFADQLEGQNSTPVLTCISTAGNALFLAGQSTTQITVSQNGITPISGIYNPIYGQSGPTSALASVLENSETNLFAKEYEVVIQRSIAVQAQLAAAILPAGPGGVPNPTPQLDSVAPFKPIDTTLATNLQTVARIIGARSSLGMTRQIFFINQGGYDTHDAEVPIHRARMNELNLALTYFDQVLTSMGLENDVTTFTISDFGRTLTSNSDGTDHGWGNHHIVMGGAVKGGDIYGQWPVIGNNEENDVGYGRLLPGISVEQYAGTLGSWMGLSQSQLSSALPNLGNFGSSPLLGFMG